ncbi:MAG: aldo/keto reductase [Lachnospiraceae bacterium]|jgi:predicted aldo/keto reductase-like oxidoreductase|nr:aldo/keto reductase [Lachnospiraceae bacterium]
MVNVRLGSTRITVNKNGFGALPIQRVSMEEAIRLLHRAFDGGIRFYDTARLYTDSEEKLGQAFPDRRSRIFLASKTGAVTAEGFWKDLETTLKNLKTDYLDIYQFHNPAFCPKPGDESGLYDAALEARKKGMILHIGITNHRLNVAQEAIDSGLYETLQFPFCYLSGEPELKLLEGCKKQDMGFLSMKALSGGLITNAAAAFAFQAQFPETLPLWGIQREEELEQFLSFVDNPPSMNEELSAVIEKDRKELLGEFCRGCGYCMPCPAGIEINNCARMSLLLRRAPSAGYLTPQWQEKMQKIEDCKHCDSCKKKCPYGLDTPKLLKKNYEDYKEILNGKKF